MVQTTDGGFALAGTITEYREGYSEGLWLVKTDANGVATWNQTYRGKPFDEAYALIQTADGGFALAGNTWLFDAGERDMWLVIIDANSLVLTGKTPGLGTPSLIVAVLVLITWHKRKK